MNCYYCKTELVKYQCSKETPIAPSNGYTRDHIGKEITVPCCFKCNQKKGQLSMHEWKAVMAWRLGLIKLPQFKFPGET